jgi:hypothetical protein
MTRLGYSLPIVLLLAACGGGDSSEKRTETGSAASASNGDDLDACSLLTPEEIQAAAGWTPDTADADTHQTTKTCTYTGPNALKQSIVIVVARPVPEMSSSAEWAEYRNKQAQRQPDFKMIITPVEGLGVPAVRSELEGVPTPTIEAAVRGRLLGITTSSFDVAKALVPKAAARLP